MLMDRHGTSRVLFRNTRNGVKGFPKRELHTIRLPLPTQYQTAIKVSGIMGARKPRKSARATCSIRSRSIRNLKVIPVPVELRPARRVADGLPDQPSLAEGAGNLR